MFKGIAINWVIRYHVIKYRWKSHLSVSGVIISTGNQILESRIAMGNHRRSDPRVLTAHLQGGCIKLLNALRSVTVLLEKHRPFPKELSCPPGPWVSLRLSPFPTLSWHIDPLNGF